MRLALSYKKQLSHISNTTRSASSDISVDTEKWVDKRGAAEFSSPTRLRGVWISDEKLSGVFEIINNSEIQRESWQNFMVIKIRYPNHCHGRDFLCFLFMNYWWVREVLVLRIYEIRQLCNDASSGCRCLLEINELNLSDSLHLKVWIRLFLHRSRTLELWNWL